MKFSFLMTFDEQAEKKRNALTVQRYLSAYKTAPAKQFRFWVRFSIKAFLFLCVFVESQHEIKFHISEHILIPLFVEMSTTVFTFPKKRILYHLVHMLNNSFPTTYASQISCRRKYPFDD